MLHRTLVLLGLVGLAASQGDPIAAATGLITRLLGPNYVSSFTLQVISVDPATGKDVFELDTAQSKVVIRGNNGVALASGLHWYLKYYVNCSITWGRDGSGNQA